MAENHIVTQFGVTAWGATPTDMSLTQFGVTAWGAGPIDLTVSQAGVTVWGDTVVRYYATGSGGVTFSGTSNVTSNRYRSTATGGIVLSGLGTCSLKLRQTSLGGVTFGGTSLVSNYGFVSTSMTGGVLLSGESIDLESYYFKSDSLGRVSLSGEAINTVILPYESIGGISLSGVADCSFLATQNTQILIFGGSALCDYVPFAPYVEPVYLPPNTCQITLIPNQYGKAFYDLEFVYYINNAYFSTEVDINHPNEKILIENIPIRTQENFSGISRNSVCDLLKKKTGDLQLKVIKRLDLIQKQGQVNPTTGFTY